MNPSLRIVFLGLALLSASNVHADPRLTSWMTTNSTKYGRVTKATTGETRAFRNGHSLSGKLR